ncbi:MAG: Uncharacterised protein [Halieaceae bacterium]|nr:MAG: Uncharacterised protein [Halieaceae bacterium]
MPALASACVAPLTRPATISSFQRVITMTYRPSLPGTCDAELSIPLPDIGLCSLVRLSGVRRRHKFDDFKTKTRQRIVLEWRSQ